MNKMDISKFKLIDIVDRSNLNESECKSKCCFCDKSINRISIFDKCLHYSCLDCLDSLYDLYNTNKKYDNDMNIIFFCPLCNEKVYDVTYKDL